MKILLLGATGRTGKYVVDEALQQGYELNCLVRDSQKIKHASDRLMLLEGLPENIADVEQSAQNCEAIISVLNVSRNSDFPWSNLRTPPTFLSDVMRNVIKVAEKHNIKKSDCVFCVGCC
jgi:putative NADH-flavin reductase